jgi:hypothetical protein
MFSHTYVLTEMKSDATVLSRGDMREADMKCKVAACLLSSPPDHFLLLAPSHLPFPRPPATLTRSGKDVPESSFCYQFISRYRSFLRKCVQMQHQYTNIDDPSPK